MPNVTRRLMLVTSLALVAAACADPSASTESPAGSVGYPTGSDDLIVSIGWEGGFVPVEYTFTAAPFVALYGDGTLITPGAQAEIYPGPALPPFVSTSLTDAEVQAIVADAIDAGLDRDGDYSDLGNMAIADAGTAVFTLTTDEGSHRVTAYALGMAEQRNEGQPEEVWQARRRLATFMDRMTGQLGTGGAGAPYDPEAAALLISPYRGDGDLPQPPIAWPVPGTLASAGAPWEPLGPDTRCAVLAGDEWEAVERLALQANQLTPWTDDGERFSIVFRPLLPHEATCPGT